MLKLLKNAAELVLPRVCTVCGGQLLPSEKHICICCEADFPETLFASQEHNPMADAFNAGIEGPGYARACALFFYSSESPYSNITKTLKYHGNRSAGRFFASLLAKRMLEGGLYSDVDAVVPVPLHWTRLWKRGYNQAEVIAAGLAAALPGARLRPELLKRVKLTRSQARLSGAGERSANVRGAFRAAVPKGMEPSVAGGSCPCSDLATRNWSGMDSFVCAGSRLSAKAAPRHILLVDDVFTTGATLCECCNCLRDSLGPNVRISAATLGYVA